MARLRRQSFDFTRHSTDQELERYLELVFLRNPWADPELPSLVYEDDDGEIRGFLGVVPRPFELKSRSLRAAVTTQFMVAPSSRGLPGVELLRRVFAGPQDFLIADIPNPSARKLWTGLGGMAARAYGFNWTIPLRPFRRRAACFGTAKPVRAARLLARPLIALADLAATRVPGSPYHVATSTLSESPLTVDEMCARMASFTDPRSLRPVYDPQALRWLMERVHEKWGLEQVEKLFFRDHDGAEVGWAIYVSRRGGVAQVLSLAASQQMHSAVIEMLRFRALKNGAIALRGRVFPDSLSALSIPGLSVDYGGKDVLVHARECALREAVLSGQAFLSGLEGEWWMDF